MKAVKCELCDKLAVDIWINPYNIHDYSWLCGEHVTGFEDTFKNLELVFINLGMVSI